MANQDAAFGLKPVDSPYGGIRVDQFQIAASYASNLFIQDPVALTTTGTIIRASTANSSATILGAIVGFLDQDDVPQKYWASGTANAWTVLVTTDPNQTYEIQCDSDTVLAQADIGESAPLAFAAGDTVTGMSRVELDTSAISTTAAQLRILKVTGDIANSELGASHTNVIVKLEKPQMAAAYAGAPV